MKEGDGGSRETPAVSFGKFLGRAHPPSTSGAGKGVGGYTVTCPTLPRLVTAEGNTLEETRLRTQSVAVTSRS
jgi:hypothetical protein